MISIVGLLVLSPTFMAPAKAEVYLGGQVGVVIPQSFQNPEGIGRLTFPDSSAIGMKDSFVYGGKVGYFLPSFLALDWLGIEADIYHSTPHLKHAGFFVDGAPAGQGVLLGVTTAAFRVLIRAPGRRPEERAQPFTSWYQRLQPYLGFGPAVFFTRASTASSSSNDTAVGFSFQAGSRFFLTRQVALFAEYKLDAAALSFNNALAPGAGLKGDYTGHNVVAGLSYHFDY
jgi:hypothetical protein